MRLKPIRPREQARRDVDAAIDFYVSAAGEEVALGFVDAIEAAWRAISEHPSAGSPRYAHELNLPGLRSRLVEHYPYLTFYVEHDDHIDVWRVLHVERDIPALTQDPKM